MYSSLKSWSSLSQPLHDWTRFQAIPPRSADWSFWIRTSAQHLADAPTHSTHQRSPKMARLEAALFLTDSPLSNRKLMQFASLTSPAEVRTLIDQLNAAYDAARSSFRIERLASGYQLFTRREFAPWLDRLHQRQTRMKLSASAMETLAVICYRQPITRADIELVRGVSSIEMVKHLMDRGLVKIVGEDTSLGRPFLYGTTKQFLEHYGLRSLEDLPLADRLRRAPKTVPGVTNAEDEEEEAEETALATAES